MGVLDRLKRLTGSESAEEETITYQCRACNNTFESTEKDMSEVTCKHCGDHNVRHIPK